MSRYPINAFCRANEPERSRTGRQQNGDTYTLEISFPAVKYVLINRQLYISKTCTTKAFFAHFNDFLWLWWMNSLFCLAFGLPVLIFFRSFRFLMTHRLGSRVSIKTSSLMKFETNLVIIFPAAIQLFNRRPANAQR
jgi:hypothetical protein